MSAFQTTRSLARLAAVVTASLVACGGQSTPSGSGGGTSTASGKPLSASFSASQVSAALANCNLPHGPAVIPTDQTREAQLAVGAWAACPDPSTPAPASLLVPGIVLFPPGSDDSGQWMRLETNASGGLSTVVGVQNQGQWFAPNAVDVDVETVGGGPGGAGGGTTSFETNPRRMYIVTDQTDCPDCAALELWLVPLQ